MSLVGSCTFHCPLILIPNENNWTVKLNNKYFQADLYLLQQVDSSNLLGLIESLSFPKSWIEGHLWRSSLWNSSDVETPYTEKKKNWPQNVPSELTPSPYPPHCLFSPFPLITFRAGEKQEVWPKRVKISYWRLHCASPFTLRCCQGLWREKTPGNR